MSAKSRSTAAVVICAAAFLYASPLFPQADAGDELVHFHTTAALAETGRYEVDGLVNRWGILPQHACRSDQGDLTSCRASDPETHQQASPNNVVALEAPGMALLGVPGYSAYVYLATRDGGRAKLGTALRICRATATILPFLFFLFCFHGFLTRRKEPKSLAEAAFLTVALGSPLYAYGILFAGHAQAAALAFGAFMIGYDARARGRTDGALPFIGGLLAGAIPLFDLDAFPTAAILLGYVLATMPRRSALQVIAGAALPMAVLAHHQLTVLGAFPFVPDARVPRGLSSENLFTLLFDGGLGLFTLTPLFIFGIPGFAIVLRDASSRFDGGIALACVVSTLLWASSVEDPVGPVGVGARHLAIAMPFLGWAAIPGLALVANRFPRVGDVAALGTTIIGIAAAGLPSVYYPHLPRAIYRPVVQLMGVLTGHDYAPDNVMNLFMVWGSASMFPLFALWVFAVAWVAWQRRVPLADRISVLAGAALVAGLMLGPKLSAEPPSDAVRQAVASVTRNWRPSGHDEAAGLEAHLAGSGDATPEGYELLAKLYREEGRDAEAAVAERSGQLLRERNAIIEARSPD